jgi:hypothetical protein
MSTNKDLLKQAIAEAKTIREAAIANAKEALEESLTPHLREMLAQKLQEMDNEDEDEFDPSHGIEDAQQNIERGLYEAEDEDEAEEEAEEEGQEEEEVEEEDEDIKIEDMSVEDLKDLIRGIVAQETGAEEGMEDELPADDLGAEDMTGMEDGEEEIDINELLAELAEMDGQADEDDTTMEGMKSKMEGMKNPKMEGMKKPNPMEEDLNEALKTVHELKKQLQEVNLLNAKLLYVNKVFKTNNLSEGQKVNVIAAFDKAETVKEVKLVFETVSKNVVPKQAVKSPIKEHRSFASKPAGSTKKQVINEVSEAVTRMQILAGIKPREY